MKYLTLILVCLITHVVVAQQATDSIAPEKAGKILKKQVVVGKEFMVVAANPLAVKAGHEVLKLGGTAADAMVAVQTVLGLVEPQASGLGGGAFVVYFNAEDKRLTTFDGRETAPLDATPELFQDENGNPLKFYDAVVGGRSVGTPGTVKLLETVHKRYGQKPWKSLFKTAINLANKGFEVSPRLSGAIERDKERLHKYQETRVYFFDKDSKPLQVGHLLKNPAYAKTLQAIAKNGSDAFYNGKIAKDIVSVVQNIKDNPGVLSLKDFVNYEVKERKVVCADYFEYSVCGMGAPSSGALTVGQILGITSYFDLATLGADNPESWRIIGDASRLAFSDRGRYMADTDYVPMPTGLLDKEYLRTRANIIKANGNKVLGKDQVYPGEPVWENKIALADDQSIELPSTSHISITDTYGNILSMTTTIENGFGSRVMSNGFLLNNELTDFSFATHKNGYPIANRLEPGKRPRSSMSPTIVFKNDKPYMVIGSPGGSRIIGYVATTIIAHIAWGLDIQQAIAMPHLINRFGTYDLEKGTSAEGFKEQLEAIGYKINIRDLNSGLHAIHFDEDGTLYGGADPRREGLAMGGQ